MAGGPPHTLFKPGNPGGGRPKGALKRDEVEAMMGKLATKSATELAVIAADPKTPAIQVMVAAVMLKAIETGDYARLQFLLDRSIGKVKEVVEQHNHNHDEEFEKADPKSVIELLRKPSNG